MNKETASGKEVVQKGANPVSHLTAEAWGNDVAVSGQDIIIGKLLLMQGLSELVTDAKARMGEFRDSLTGNLVADVDKEFEFLPFHVEKFWDIHDDEGGWLRTEALIEQPQLAGYNDNLPWKDKEDGQEIRRIRRMNFYGLLTSEVAGGTSVPYTISFRSMAFKEGKKLFTQMYLRNRRANLPPCGYVVKVKGVRRENDKGKFYVPVIELGRKANEAEVAEAFNWYTMMKKGAVKVDESDISKTETGAVPDTGEY